MVCGVSALDHEIGRHARHSVPPVPVVFQQPPSSNVAAHSIVSFGSLMQLLHSCLACIRFRLVTPAPLSRIHRKPERSDAEGDDK